MHSFTQKYPSLVWKTLILGLIFTALPLALWAELPPDKGRLKVYSQLTFDSDPIRFRLAANKQQVKPNEEIELTITAQHVSILASQLFTLPSSNAFRLKLLLPEGFIQTGGDYIDYIGTELSAANPTVTYTLRGYFSRKVGQVQFRLLRGSAQANETSLFIEKAQVWIQLEGRPDIARQAAARLTNDYANLSVNCDNSTLNVNGILTTSNNQVGILLFKDGSIVSSSEQSASFNQNFPLSGSGNYYAKVREINNDGNEINSASISVNCSATPNPPANPTPPSGNCSYSEGQYLFTTSWGEATYAYYYNGVLYAAYQDGSNFKPQHWLVATGLMNSNTTSCFAENDPRTTSNPPTNPPSNPNPLSGNCNYSEGQYLFTFNAEVMYAHYYNGTLYAGYQNGSEFRPQHWLVATGLMDSNKASCFAENDPHNGSSNPSNPNPPTNTNGDCSVTSPRGVVDALNGTGIWGWALDESDFNKTVTIDIYVNGVKVASGKAREDRSDLVPAFGNNPAARYHGFHTEWNYNREGNNTYTITAKICGTNTVLASQQITFSGFDNSGARKPICEGCILLKEVTVRATKPNPEGPTDWTNEGEGSGDSGNTGNPGNPGHNGGNNPGGTGTDNTSGNQTSSYGNKGGSKPYSAQPTSTTNPSSLTNPKDGETYIDSEGNIIIYNAKLGGWMLPEALISPYDQEAAINVPIPWLFVANQAIGQVIRTTAGWVLICISLEGDTRPGQLLSKGGDRNIWPDEYGFPPRVQDVNWSKGDDQLADEYADAVGDKKRGQGTSHGNAKKWLRYKRPK